MTEPIARLALASTFALLLCGCADAGHYAVASEQGCITILEHDRSLQNAMRLYGRSAILTHTDHPPVRDRCAPPSQSRGAPDKAR